MPNLVADEGRLTDGNIVVDIGGEIHGIFNSSQRKNSTVETQTRGCPKICKESGTTKNEQSRNI